MGKEKQYPVMEMTFSLAQFEGPLDLLLTLVSKNKMNIYDIRIMELIDQYLEIVRQGRSNGMDAASEFVEMSARLIYMKSVFLLPRTEEQERLKEELTGLLVEYSACKEIAQKLGQRYGRVFYATRPPAKLEEDTLYRVHHSPEILRQALLAAKGKAVPQKTVSQQNFEPLVSAPVVSVSSRIVHLLRGLVKTTGRQLQSFFSTGCTRSETVATFLAVLELVRAGRVRIDEDQQLSLTREHRRGEVVAEE